MLPKVVICHKDTKHTCMFASGYKQAGQMTDSEKSHTA